MKLTLEPSDLRELLRDRLLENELAGLRKQNEELRANIAEVRATFKTPDNVLLEAAKEDLDKALDRIDALKEQIEKLKARRKR